MPSLQAAARSPAHSRQAAVHTCVFICVVVCVRICCRCTRPPASVVVHGARFPAPLQMFDDERSGQYAPADIGRTAGCAFRGGVFDASVEHQQLQLNSGQSPHTASVAESVVRKEQGERLTQSDAPMQNLGLTAVRRVGKQNIPMRWFEVEEILSPGQMRPYAADAE